MRPAASRTPAPNCHAECLAVKPVGELDAGNRHVQFDERGWETERWPLAPSYRAHPRLYRPLEQGDVRGLEGVVAKHRASIYRSGRSVSWVKVKCPAWREANRNRGELFGETRLLSSLRPPLSPDISSQPSLLVERS